MIIFFVSGLVLFQTMFFSCICWTSNNFIFIDFDTGCFVQETFEKNGASKFWQHFDVYSNVAAREMIMDRVCTFDNFTMVCWVTIICYQLYFTVRRNA